MKFRSITNLRQFFDIFSDLPKNVCARFVKSQMVKNLIFQIRGNTGHLNFHTFSWMNKSVFLKFVKNYPRVFKVTSTYGWIEAKLLEIKGSSWTTFLLIMNVSFIWHRLNSQQILSFLTVGPFYFLVDNSSYFRDQLEAIISIICSTLVCPSPCSSW